MFVCGYGTFLLTVFVLFVLCTGLFPTFWSWAIKLTVQINETRLAKVGESSLDRIWKVNQLNCERIVSGTGGTFHTEFGLFMTSAGSNCNCKSASTSMGGSETSADLKKEALAALHVAQEMETCGKLRKASKLFQHAVALDPSNSEILTEYGTFLLEHHQDILKADTLYLRAVHADPDNHRALALRVRTQPLVEQIDQKAFDRIDLMMHEFYSIPQWDAMMIRKKRMAFIWQLYHSVAIEGNTMSFLETKQVVERRIAVGGKSIMEHNEILGMDAALQFLNESLVSRIGPIRLVDILDMHLRVLGYNDPINAGKYRQTQVYVSNHIPPEPHEVPLLMEEFMDWVNSEDAAEMHPIKLATLAHYFLVHIHPFVDGNGRVARLLMNLILMRSGLPPVVIRVNQRKLYYQFLKDANAGDIRPFIRFVTQCTELTLNEYLYSASDTDMFHEFPTLLGEEEGLHDKILLPFSMVEANSI